MAQRNESPEQRASYNHTPAAIERRREYNRKRGKTPEYLQYQREQRKLRRDRELEPLRAAQGCLCKICERVLVPGGGPGKPATECVDHCHETGRVRGLLCSTCNLCLGHYEKQQRGRITIDVYERYLAVSDP